MLYCTRETSGAPGHINAVISTHFTLYCTQTCCVYSCLSALHRHRGEAKFPRMSILKFATSTSLNKCSVHSTTGGVCYSGRMGIIYSAKVPNTLSTRMGRHRYMYTISRSIKSTRLFICVLQAFSIPHCQSVIGCLYACNYFRIFEAISEIKGDIGLFPIGSL